MNRFLMIRKKYMAEKRLIPAFWMIHDYLLKRKILTLLFLNNGMSRKIVYSEIQSDPNQNPLFQMALPLKLCISDPMLVKPKCV